MKIEDLESGAASLEQVGEPVLKMVRLCKRLSEVDLADHGSLDYYMCVFAEEAEALIKELEAV